MHRGLLILYVLFHVWFSGVATQCESGLFGDDCSGICHCLNGSEFCDMNDGRCTQGPCKPGWTNTPLCQTECPEGSFGLNCSETCHCNTDEECNAVNGHCASNECATNWTGPACKIRIPLLNKPPSVTSINNSQVTLTWNAYHPNGSSENIVSSYLVQMLRNATGSDWVDVRHVSPESRIAKYTVTTPRLESLNNGYKFRVKIVWLNSNKPQISETGSGTDWIVCREPTGSLGRIHSTVINRRTGTIMITWQGPDGYSGCDRYAFLMINVTCKPECQPISRKVILPSSSSIVTVSRRNLSASTVVTIKVNAFNNAGLGSRHISTSLISLRPSALYDSTDYSSGPASTTTEGNLEGSSVDAFEDTSNISKEISLSENVTKAAPVYTFNSEDIVSMSEHVTEITSTVLSTVSAANITDRKEGPFEAAAGSIDLEKEVLTDDTGASTTSDAGQIVGVISAPHSQPVTSHEQQKRFQLYRRSQHMMSFRETTTSDQSSSDSDGSLQVAVREGESMYAVVSSGGPYGITVDSNVIVISNLKAGTLYQVNISSKLLTSKSEDKPVFSASHWTLMQAPQKLSPPQLVDIGNTSITLRVYVQRMARRATASDGEVAIGILVVVEPDLNNGSRFKALTESGDVLVHDAVAVSSKDYPLRGFRSKETTPYYVTLEVDSPPKDGVIVVGNNRIYGRQDEYYNAPLTPDTRYWLWIGMASSLDGVVQRTITPIEYPVRTVGAIPPEMMKDTADDNVGDGDDQGLSSGSVAAIVLGLILLFLILCLMGICWYKYREKQRASDTPTAALPTYRPVSEVIDGRVSEVIDGRISEVTYGRVSEVTDPKLDTVFAVASPLEEGPTPESRRSQQQNAFDSSFYVMKANQPIPVGKLRHRFETHLRPNSHYALQDEFRRLPDGFTDTINVANLAYNASLNRSQAIVPYDKNRVKLARQYPNDSVYINASFIRTIGYRSCVVTQCPTAATTNEFWRMVWELQVGTIVMLLATRECSGPEYYHYWPRKSKPLYYRDVRVQLMREDRLAHHEVREFRLSCTSDKVEVRRVLHWQYVQWKPGGIPDHPIPFLNMLAAIHEEHDPESGFVIHCLKGGGRSGVYAAVDALVYDGKQSGKVDVLECVTLLRLERVCLVKSLKQYRFVYHCLIEAFNCHETRTPVHRFHFLLANLLARNELDSLTRFEKEYSAVQLECHAVRPYMLATSYGTRFSSVGTRSSIPDQRELEVTEGDRRTSDDARSYAFLPSDKPGTVLLDGCYTKDAFVLCSPPVKANLEGFWEMISENNASCIVMLNKAEDMSFAACFLPDDGSSVDAGRYTVYCDSVLIHPNSSFYVHNLCIVLKNNSNSENAVSSVRLYEFSKWPKSLEVPLVDAVLDLTINVADWSQRVGGGRPTIMFSMHGGDRARAALFAIAWMMIDPIQHDGAVDVYSAARYVYSYLPIALSSMDQYHFLYRVMEEHVIRIETQKWRPEKVSESVLPSALFKSYTSDGNVEERTPTKSPSKRGCRRKLKRMSSDGSAFQSLRKKKKDSKCVRVDSSSDAEDQAPADEMKKFGTDADSKRVLFSPTAFEETTEQRWQSPDKTGKWNYKDPNKKPCPKTLPDKTPKVAQEKPETKPVAQKYEPCDVIPLCSRLRDQPTIPEPSVKSDPSVEPSVKSPVATTKFAPTTPQPSLDAIAQQKPSPTAGTSSDELPPTSKKAPATKMRCKCKMICDATGSPTGRLQCRCNIKHLPVQSDDSDNQKPVDQTGVTSTAQGLSTTKRKAKPRKDKLELPKYGSSLKAKSSALSKAPSDEDKFKCLQKPLTTAEKQRRGLSLGRNAKPAFRYTGASSSDEDRVRSVSPKRSSLKQPGIVIRKKSSSLERRTQRKFPPSSAVKNPQKFDEKECRSVSPDKEAPFSAHRDVKLRTRFSDEKISGGQSSGKDWYSTGVPFKGRNDETRDMTLDQFQDFKCLKKPGKGPFLKERSSSPAGKRSPSVYTSSQSDDADIVTPSIGPELKSQKREQRRHSLEISSPPEDRPTRTPRLTDRTPDRQATDSKAVSQEEKSPSPLRRKTPRKISPTQDPSNASRSRKPPATTHSKEGEINHPKSQCTPKKKGRVSPVNRPRRSSSPAGSSFRVDRTQQNWPKDQKRSRRSPSRERASPKRSNLSSRSSSRERSSGCEKNVTTSNRQEVNGISPSPITGSLEKSGKTRDKEQINSFKITSQKTGATVDPAGSEVASENVLSSAQILSTKSDKTRIDIEDFEPSAKIESNQQPRYFQPSARAKTSSVGCEIKQRADDADASNVSKPIASIRAQQLRPVKDDAQPNLQSLSDLSIDTRMTLERVQAQLVNKDSKLQDLKPEAKPRGVNNESQNVKQQTPDNQAPAQSFAPACSRKQETSDNKDPAQSTAPSCSRKQETSDNKDPAQSTAPACSRKQETSDNKDPAQSTAPACSRKQETSDTKDPAQRTAPACSIKQQTSDSQTPSPSSAPACSRKANVPAPEEATSPSEKVSSKAPVADTSIDDLLGGFYYASSAVSTTSGRTTDSRQRCQTGLRFGPAKAVDSSLSPEVNAGIHSPASHKSDASPQPASCSTLPAVGQGFHPGDIDIPYIDDTDSGSAHELRQK